MWFRSDSSLLCKLKNGFLLAFLVDKHIPIYTDSNQWEKEIENGVGFHKDSFSAVKRSIYVSD